MFYVYQIINILNGKIYIGKASDPAFRLKDHLRVAKGGRHKYGTKYQLIHEAIAKYGIDNFDHRVIQSFMNEDESLVAEKYWIDFFKTNIIKYGKEFGYNLSDGGRGSSGHRPSDFSREKNRNSHIGKIHSEQTRKEMSLSKLGKSIGNTFSAKLDVSQVKEIRSLYEIGWSRKDLATKFSVKQNTISQIVNNKSWKLI